MVQVHALRLAARRPHPRSQVGRGGRGQILFPRGHLLEHGVDGGMVMLERQEKTGQAPHRPCGGNGLGQRSLTVGNGFAFPCNRHAGPFVSDVFRSTAFLANLYRIAVLYG